MSDITVLLFLFIIYHGSSISDGTPADEEVFFFTINPRLSCWASLCWDLLTENGLWWPPEEGDSASEGEEHGSRIVFLSIERLNFLSFYN